MSAIVKCARCKQPIRADKDAEYVWTRDGGVSRLVTIHKDCVATGGVMPARKVAE